MLVGEQLLDEVGAFMIRSYAIVLNGSPTKTPAVNTIIHLGRVERLAFKLSDKAMERVKKWMTRIDSTASGPAQVSQSSKFLLLYPIELQYLYFLSID